MVDLNWCKKQKRGIMFVEPNFNLAKEYLENAEETLEVLRDIKNTSNMWLATTKYYFEYFCTYSILMRIGIKCEIHDCSIEIINFPENKKIMPEIFKNILKKDKGLRIDNQYYLKNKKVSIDYDALREIYLRTKEFINNISEDNINKIRGLL